ncbi:hypothetical protein [Pontibacter sp. G13]|uniref:hypothetical protein n=1 Tax=Pontibacter sp. G13 TaxID=3074898 RepID=UPI0028898623|nr:hypothetical protein [Pontibacter sp. G13]WNJ17721.1 hypothetical protein RJD25_22955 [Pontibacter sp. G13]
MNSEFTDPDILRFLYDEMKPAECDRFMQELCTNEELWERFETFQEMAEKIPTFELEPSQASTDRIMDFVNQPRQRLDPMAQMPDASTSFNSLIGKFLNQINLNLIVAASLILFITAGMMSSIYQIHIDGSQSAFQQGSGLNYPVESSFHLQWDDSYLDAELERVQQNLEQLGKSNIL